MLAPAATYAEAYDTFRWRIPARYNIGVTYGLLTAAISRTDMSGELGTALIADNVADMVPVTNPFLKEMLETFLKAGGRRGGIDFDELGIQDVVELLRDREKTDLHAVLRDFGNKTRGEDPVIHFYEHFLSAYNHALRIQRGVFYTPQPVVSYIVRSVHELLQTEFGLADGLVELRRGETTPLVKEAPDDEPEQGEEQAEGDCSEASIEEAGRATCLHGGRRGCGFCGGRLSSRSSRRFRD